MIITYIRSSSYNQYDYCQMNYFLTYVLGYRSDSGKKADLGTMTHKVMEVLAGLKKFQQDNPKRKYLEITDDALGHIKVNKSRLLTDSYVNDLISLSFNAYKETSKNYFDPSDRKEVAKLTHTALEWNDGQFDPRFSDIIDPEPHFDIEIQEDWAKYEYEMPDGKIINGRLAIKGTIDLVTKIDDETIEVVDYKGLPVYTELPTPNGWTTMGEVQVGDIVFDKDGNQTTVTGKSKVKYKQCYKITFDDTSTVICDDEHLWLLDNNKTVCITDLKVGDNIEVAKPLDTNYVDLPIDPYVLGVWLGDGENKPFEIASDDQFNLLYNKHIPDIYMRSSHDQRLNLLRGLMDSGGSVNSTQKQAIFTNCNKRLSDDVKELLLSLGQSPYQDNAIASTNSKENVNVYPINFRPININPFYLKCKANKIDENWGVGKSSKRQVRKIEKLSTTLKTQCIMVDSPSSTYLCTKNMIPTHNTGRRLDWASGQEKDYKKLTTDPQLLLYNYAISKLYPNYKQAIMTIFFIKDGGPFSMCFDESDQEKFLEMLKNRFEEIKSNTSPKPLREDRSHWKCTKLCHFYKNKWPGTNTSMCQYIGKKLKEKGMDETVRDFTAEGHSIGYYESPG